MEISCQKVILSVRYNLAWGISLFLYGKMLISQIRAKIFRELLQIIIIECNSRPYNRDGRSQSPSFYSLIPGLKQAGPEAYIFKINRNRNRKIMDSVEHDTNNVVYLSNFPRKLRKEDLEQLLKQYGVLLSLNIIYKNDFAFAFAEFDDLRDTAFAVKELNQKVFHGMNLKVQFRNKKLKAKQLEAEDREKGKKEGQKVEQSPKSTLDTSCNIAPSKYSEKSRADERSLCRSPRESNRLRRERDQVESDFSFSRSRSRSRTKKPRQDRNRDCPRSYRNDSYDRTPQKSPEKYRERRPEPRHSHMQEDMLRMYDMIKYFGKSLRRLEQKFQDFVYEHSHELRVQQRKRN